MESFPPFVIVNKKQKSVIHPFWFGRLYDTRTCSVHKMHYYLCHYIDYRLYLISNNAFQIISSWHRGHRGEQPFDLSLFWFETDRTEEEHNIYNDKQHTVYIIIFFFFSDKHNEFTQQNNTSKILHTQNETNIMMKNVKWCVLTWSKM